ncbi:MAG: lamin tail domain-containing protein, partial [Deltaproteobacteria bacterium]|nr:lamin tail domain-containing protein [Deltaproteobacteria bacterium]
PAAECGDDGVTLTTYSSPAPCTNDGPSAVCGAYPSISVNCSDQGKVCANGKCLVDHCDPNPCTDPPPPKCDPDGVTLITYTSPAPCVNDVAGAVCGDYPSSTFDCRTDDKLCVDGGCAVVPAPGTAGDIVITEFMVRSQSGSDPGEWIEMVNTTDHVLDIGGCELKDDGTNSHVISGHLLVGPGALLLLAREDDGYTADYHYTNFFLSNEPDEIVLKCGLVEIDRVNYTDTWFDLGVSTQLDPDMFDAAANDDEVNWCPGTVDYGDAGKKGTPGAPNVECPGAQVGWCRLQWPLDPPDSTTAAGTDLTVYGRVFLDGVTNLTTGVDEDPELIAQVGYGPDGSAPDGNTDWTWVMAVGNPMWSDTEEPGNDEYMGALNVAVAGTYDHAYRFSADGGATWTYCDRRTDDISDGSKDGYQIDKAGSLLITNP